MGGTNQPISVVPEQFGGQGRMIMFEDDKLKTQHDTIGLFYEPFTQVKASFWLSLNMSYES
jgi:hypothetical protein